MMRVASLLLALSLFTSVLRRPAPSTRGCCGERNEPMRQLKRLGFGGCSVRTSLSRTVKRVVMQYAECDFPTTYLSSASPTPWTRAKRSEHGVVQTLSAC